MPQIGEIVDQVFGEGIGYHSVASESTEDVVLDKTQTVERGDDDHSKVWLQWLWSALPFFLTAPLGKSNRKLPKVTSTTYLNGIRGVACVIVFNYHVMGDFFGSVIFHAFGAPPAGQNLVFVQFPIIRVFYAGTGMVCLFFVLSGFVLSYSPILKIVSHGSSSDIVTSLCGAVLRRGIRLFLPMVCVTILTCLVTYLFPQSVPPGWRYHDLSFFGNLFHYIRLTLSAMSPWAAELPLSFEHCWTLAYEYRGSLIIYLFCMVGSRLTTLMRKAGLAWVMFWSLYYGRWDLTTFASGMFLAELHHCPFTEDFEICARINSKLSSSTKQIIAAAVLFFSLYCLSWPQAGPEVEPFKTAATFSPPAFQQRTSDLVIYWGGFGSFWLLVATENFYPIQWLLTTTPFLYLGEISFSFYLLHWIFYQVPGKQIFIYMRLHGWGELSSFWTLYVLTLVMLVATADLFWRAIDVNSVKISKTLVERLGVTSWTEPTTEPVSYTPVARAEDVENRVGDVRS